MLGMGILANDGANEGNAFAPAISSRFRLNVRTTGADGNYRPCNGGFRHVRKKSASRCSWGNFHTDCSLRSLRRFQKSHKKINAPRGRQPAIAKPRSNEPVLSTNRPKYLCAGDSDQAATPATPVTMPCRVRVKSCVNA